MKTKKVAVALACVAAVVVAISALTWVCYEGLTDDNFIEKERELYVPAERRLSDVDVPQDVFIVGGEQVEYTFGEYGSVIVENAPAIEDFSSEEAWRHYQLSWHDRSWKGEMPESGRYQYAHYEDNDELRWVAGELLVTFGDEVSDDEVHRVAGESGAFVVSIDSFGVDGDHKIACFAWRDETIDPLESAKFIQRTFAAVESAFPNVVGELDAAPSDPKLSEQDYIELSRFDKAWDVVKCNGAATVAVLDSGVDFYHTDLADNIDATNAYDAIERELLTRRDANGHGTMVAGVVAMRADNGIDGVGCSYNATILPVRVADDNGNIAVLDVGEALGHLFDLEDKPDVVNMSFGAPASNLIVKLAYETVCQNQIDELSGDYGIVFVAAVGNDGESSNAVMYPAGLPGVIGVGSVDADESRSAFSSANSTVDVCAQGSDVWTTFRLGAGGYNEGTSFAAPQVAAAAALLKVQHPSWNVAQVEARLESTAVDLGASGRDDEYGYGLLDAASAVGWVPSTPVLGGSFFDAYRELEAER